MPGEKSWTEADNRLAMTLYDEKLPRARIVDHIAEVRGFHRTTIRRRLRELLGPVRLRSKIKAPPIPPDAVLITDRDEVRGLRPYLVGRPTGDGWIELTGKE